ncbi:hypothetical protein B0I32_123189 [Nonomuraea fuscirosea]|uniref:Uncharacterized protein n=1 Tax=Nonomuraea fuscirosea TaxID=1291556 RepID=A0A2T0MLE5_9ACTN|nr:hypothetical protein B0I32_123189 [Nonomuraea fuscirosea]
MIGRSASGWRKRRARVLEGPAREERPRRAGDGYLPRRAAQTSIRGVVTSVPALV